MDFYVVLGRAGFDIGKRKHKKASMGASHKISKDEAIKWFQQTYEGVIMPGRLAGGERRSLPHGARSRWQAEASQQRSPPPWQEEINHASPTTLPSRSLLASFHLFLSSICCSADLRNKHT